MIPMEVSTIQSFLDYFNKIRERTMRVVACIPPDKIEWRAAPTFITGLIVSRPFCLWHGFLGRLKNRQSGLFGAGSGRTFTSKGTKWPVAPFTAWVAPKSSTGRVAQSFRLEPVPGLSANLALPG
jgi:hypothetical protein